MRHKITLFWQALTVHRFSGITGDLPYILPRIIPKSVNAHQIIAAYPLLISVELAERNLVGCGEDFLVSPVRLANQALIVLEQLLVGRGFFSINFVQLESVQNLRKSLFGDLQM